MFLELIRFLIDETIVEVVQVVDLVGYPPVPAGHAFEILSQRNLELHLGFVQGDDTSAGTVYTHLVLRREHVQSDPGLCMRNVTSNVTRISIHLLVPQHAACIGLDCSQK